MSDDLPLRRDEFANDQLGESRLAVPVCADESDSTALLDREGDVGEERGLGAGKAVLDLVEMDEVAQRAKLFGAWNADLRCCFLFLCLDLGSSCEMVACECVGSATSLADPKVDAPTRSRFSLKRCPAADCSRPHRSSSFFCLDLTMRYERKASVKQGRAGALSAPVDSRPQSSSHSQSHAGSTSPHARASYPTPPSASSSSSPSSAPRPRKRRAFLRNR